ncbi:MAG: bifunctional demethylmenaquinone methyltransferase/2-methoxy-6-polyprenyl-1,4-benzoquinol methylase UbiE [Planctomycetota bacterium]
MTQNAPAKPTTDTPAWSSDELASSPHANEQKADKVRRMFSAIAHAYDLNNRLHSFGRDQAWRKAAVRLADVRPTDEVLDMACGTGDLTRAFADAGAKRVVGGDFTAPMLDIARTKRLGPAREPDRANIEYVLADAMNLPFEDDSFDVLSIAFGIRNVAEPDKAFAEFKRVLRPGGRLIVLEFSEPTNPLLRLGNDVWTKRVMPLTATLISRDTSGAYAYLPRSIETFLTREDMTNAMERAGFASVAQRPMTFGVVVAYRGDAR